MKRKLQHIILSVMMMTATYALMAQSEYQDQVRTTNATVTKHCLFHPKSVPPFTPKVYH